jgi:hypothetical protein
MMNIDLARHVARAVFRSAGESQQTKHDMCSNLRNIVTVTLGCCLLFSATAYAATKSKTAVSGRPTRVAAYHSWDPNSCASLAATMNVLVQPAHGVLIPRVVPHVITTSRFGTVAHCTGHSIKALQIEYKSAPGYRGVDTFTIDVIFGFEGRRDTDTYTVTVR